MKVEVRERKSDKPFPKLMIRSDGLIILVFSREENSSIEYKSAVLNSVTGWYSSAFLILYDEEIEQFKDLEGEVVLSND